jgi:hypothetical protein
VRGTTGHNIDDVRLEANVLIDNGDGSVICISRDGGVKTESSTSTPNVEETPIMAPDPETGEMKPTGKTTTVTLTTTKTVTLSCGSKTWTVDVCIPGARPCPPVNRRKPNGKDVAIYQTQFIDWPTTLSPRFAPNFTSGRTNTFAITQAPTYYWFTAADWQPLEAYARACILDDCVTSVTRAEPIRAWFDPGTDELVACDGPGQPVTTPALYEAGRQKQSKLDLPTNECQYTYKHSSSLQPGRKYVGTASVEYEITLIDEGRPSPGPDAWFVEEDLNIPVGEIESVVR